MLMFSQADDIHRQVNIRTAVGCSKHIYYFTNKLNLTGAKQLEMAQERSWILKRVKAAASGSELYSTLSRASCLGSLRRLVKGEFN